MAREPRTLLEVIYVHTGSLRATMRVGMLVQQWALCRRDLGRRPMVEEYASWWKISERTAYRDLAAFAKAFPGEDGPDRIAVLLLANSDAIRAKLTPASVLASSPAGLLPAA